MQLHAFMMESSTRVRMSSMDEDTAPLIESGTSAPGKRMKRGYGTGKSVIHANVAEALKMRQVS